MRPLKAEVDALQSVLLTPLEEFVTDREHQTLKNPEKTAQNRMFTKAVEALDEARGERGYWTVILRMGRGESTIYQGFGPYSTKDQAQKATDALLKGVEVTAYALVPTRNEHGMKAMFSAADEPPAASSEFAEVRKDREAFKNGWDRKARTRDRYLK